MQSPGILSPAHRELLQKLSLLPGTALNSLLLELFRERAGRITPRDVLDSFTQNRFVQPSAVDTIAFKELELQWLKLAASGGFKPVLLSPLTPLGTCAAFKTIHQHNVVSALRGTEVMSDATNVFALLFARQYKQTYSREPIKYVAAERLTRAQAFAGPGFTAHFGVFCMATAGFNKGGFVFETAQLADHLRLHLSLLQGFNAADISIRVLLKEENEHLKEAVAAALQEISTTYTTDIIYQYEPNAYYHTLQFKTFLRWKEGEINLSDGGFVNWTQQLLSNQKHRMFISGVGMELVFKLFNGLL